MTAPPQPVAIAFPRRVSVSIKLGGIFLLLVLIAVGNLVFSSVMHNRIANTASIINLSGQLRYLSQKIAFNSASFALEPSEAARLTGLELETEFEMRYARVASEIEQLPLLGRSEAARLEAQMERVDAIWRRQHVALERVRAAPDLAARRAAQHEVSTHALRLLGETDHLVSALEKAAHSAHQRVRLIIYLVQALEIVLILGIFFYVRARITPPILNLSAFVQRFAVGKPAVRKD